jgi:hypothetical protein
MRPTLLRLGITVLFFLAFFAGILTFFFLEIKQSEHSFEANLIAGNSLLYVSLPLLVISYLLAGYILRRFGRK